MEASEIEQFLVFALKHYDIDPKRVYLTGLSCGAIGLWNYLGQHTNEVVAAAVPMAGYGLGAVDEAGCNLAALPIWAFHGAHDDSDPVWGDAYPLTYLQSCTHPPPSDARLTISAFGGHDVWTDVYNGVSGYDIYSWMLSHTK
jgi:poly(3-hydroxybutyrate) depolymerase